MKLLKVGRSSSCDIVLPSENVSSLHAEIIVLDNGEILISDKNSANGTIVDGKKLSPNVEVPIRRGDYVLLADTELPWSRVPKPDNLADFSKVLNIGTNFRNDIQLQDEYCSRFHAVLKISKKGNKAFIKDLNSRNGVKVNGVKIQPGKDIRIKKGDNVVCADTDITEEIRPHIPNLIAPVYKGLIAAILAIVVCIGAYYIPGLFPDKSCSYCGLPEHTLNSANDLQSAVVYVAVRYFYEIQLQDNPMKEWDGKITLDGEDMEQFSCGTAFFIDSLGRMATNRHVAFPWEYDKEGLDGILGTLKEAWLEYQLSGVRKVEDEEDLRSLRQTEFGRQLISETRNIALLNNIIDRLYRSSYKLVGQVGRRYVGYPNRHYTNYSEMDFCDVIAESESKDIDIAILQLNSGVTPAHVKQFFKISQIREDRLKPQEDKLYTIGYRGGIQKTLDQTTHNLSPYVQETKCTKTPGKYVVEIMKESQGGDSGSPVFDIYGHLVGIISSRTVNEVNNTFMCQAKYLKQLYQKEVQE